MLPLSYLREHTEKIKEGLAKEISRSQSWSTNYLKQIRKGDHFKANWMKPFPKAINLPKKLESFLNQGKQKKPMH